MAMFGTSGREAYDALYSTLEQPADVSALEREQTPDFFAGDMGSAALSGAQSAARRAELSALAGGGMPPQAELYGIGQELRLGVYGEEAQEFVEGSDAAFAARRAEVAKTIKDLRPDPKTNGMASQVLFGLTDVLGTVGLSGGNPYLAGGMYGYSQAEVGMAEGLDPLTAAIKGTIEGGALGVSVALPAALTGNLAFRAASGAALNVGVGIPERLAVSSLLRARGYDEMARQYDPLDSASIVTELVLGATFGGLLGPRARAPKLPPPEAIPPTAVDAALVANQQTHAEIHTAPGVPVDTRTRQAHGAAISQAVESLVMGRDVNVEALLTDAGFLDKRPDFDALRIITDELDKAGAADVVAQLRAIEADARARGLVVEEDTLGAVVLSDKPVEPMIEGAAVRESRVKIGEEYVPTRLMLVEAQDIQATMMKADNQFRDRTRVASEQQIADIAARLDAALLMDAPVMDYGAPVLAADGTVIGGNGRAAAVNRAYEQGTAESYRAALREQFGEAVDGMAAPMLVRVLERDVDIQKAAILSNEGGGLRMSALEQAKVDAERLGDLRGVEFTDDGMADMATIRQWVGEMPQNQRAAIMDADGRLSAEGATRLRNAVLYKAYGDSPTLSRLVESTDPGSRNVAAALMRAAPVVAEARAAIERGDLYPMGLHDDLIQGVEKLESLRGQNMSINDWAKQIDAFGDGMTAEARLLVQFMDRNIRSSRAISDGIFGFYDRLQQVGSPKQGSMFEAAQPDKGRMLELALDEGAPMYSRGTTRTPETQSQAFDGPETGSTPLDPNATEIEVDGVMRPTTNSNGQPIHPTQEGVRNFWRWFGDSKVVDAEGRPLVVYHGTTADIEQFKQNKATEKDSGWYGTGIYMTADPATASAYSGYEEMQGRQLSGSPRVMPLFASLQNPYVWPKGRQAATTSAESAAIRAELEAAGYDGVVVPNEYADPEYAGYYEVVAFNPTQIKSATGNRGTFDGADPNILMSRGDGSRETTETLTTAFRAMFGKDADRLLEAGRVRMVQSVRDLPGGPHPDDVGGMFWRGESWIVADNTGLSQIRGRVLHEIGVHAGMRDMLGEALYADVLARVEAKVGTDPVFAEARALAEARANRPEHVPEETLAYLVENAPELPVVRRLLAAVRQWLYRTTGGRFVDLTQADLQMMAVASLRRAARAAEVDGKGEGAPWYMTLFHGSPAVFKPEPGAPLGRLRWKYINTGEGAQAFGYGHYLAQNEWIARVQYRDRLVRRKGGTLELEGPNGKFIITDKDDPAWNIGGRVVHTRMGGEEEALADAAAQVARYGYQEARETFENILASSRYEFDRQQERANLRLAELPEGDTRRGMIENGLNYQRDLVAANEAALRALDEVTEPAPEGSFSAVANDQIPGIWNVLPKNGRRFGVFKSREGAEQLISTLRVLRSDIEEVRPQPPKGALYGKFIPDEQWNQMMIWDAPLSAQPENVRAAFKKIGIKEELMPKWIELDNGSIELEMGINILVIKHLKAPENIQNIARFLGYKVREVPKDQRPSYAEKTPFEITWRDGSVSWYEDALPVLQREWLLEQYGFDAPRFAVYKNGKLSTTKETLEDAKSWALEFAGIRKLTGEEAYNRLSKLVYNENGSGSLADLYIEASKETQRRRGFDSDQMDEYVDNLSPDSFAEEIASVILHSLGIPGHRFLDGNTRAKGWDDAEAKFNVVLYSDDLGRVAWEAKGETGELPTEWVTANGRASIKLVNDDGAEYWVATVDGQQLEMLPKLSNMSMDKVMKQAEDALDGQLYSRGDTIEADPLEDTTMPDARLLAGQADAEIATAQELSQGFLPAAECALRFGA